MLYKLDNKSMKYLNNNIYFIKLLKILFHLEKKSTYGFRQN
jgi:hypothetical protein